MEKSEVGEFVYVRCAKPSINSRYLSLGIKQFTLKSLQLISASESDQRIMDQARTTLTERRKDLLEILSS